MANMLVATARGSGAPLVAAAVLIALLAIGMPVGLYLTGTPISEVCGTLSPSNVGRIWLVVLGLDVGLMWLASFYASRRLLVDGEAVTYRTWFTDRRWPLGMITALTHQSSSDDSGTAHYLAFWSGSERLGRFNLFGWRRSELSAALNAMRARRPALQIDPELSGWFER